MIIKLNKITNQLNINNIFNQIIYYNRTHINYLKLDQNIVKNIDQNIEQNIDQNIEQNIDQNNELFIKTIYFLNFKCFEFKLEIEFNDR